MSVSTFNLIDFNHFSAAQVVSGISNGGYANLLVVLTVAKFDDDTLIVKITDDDNADALYGTPVTIDGHSAGLAGVYPADFHGGALPANFSVHVQLGDPGIHPAFGATATLYT